MLRRKPAKLPQFYISKKIEPTALKTALASTYQTAYRLYLITNGIKELTEFIEYEGDDYMIMGTIKTTASFIGDAKEQVWAVSHLQPLIKNKPLYTIKCSVTCKKTNKELYRCEKSSKRPMHIYNQIEEIITDIITITSIQLERP
jgi:hypothetical protein